MDLGQPLAAPTIFGRAVPWTRLILRQGRLSTDLNLDWRSRLSALAAWALLACTLRSWHSGCWGWDGWSERTFPGFPYQRFGRGWVCCWPARA